MTAVIKSGRFANLAEMERILNGYLQKYPAWEACSISHQELDGGMVSASIIMKPLKATNESVNANLELPGAII